MGPFGGSHYSLCFFIPFYPKLPPPRDGVRPEVASLADAWRGLGLTYFLLKGLTRTSKTLKLIGDTAEEYSRRDVAGKGTSATFGSDKGSWGSLTARQPVRAPPVTSQDTAGYRLSKVSQNAGQVLNPTRACKSSTSGVGKGEKKVSLTDFFQHFSADSLCEAIASSSEDSRVLIKKPFRGFGLGLQGVRTTIMGLSKEAPSKTEVKEIANVVKTADRVAEGVRGAKGVVHAFTSPVGDVLHAFRAGGNGVIVGFHAVKIVLKGVKFSKGLITVTKWCKNKHPGVIGAAADMAIKVSQNIGGKRFRAVVKGFRASEGAVNVVNITKEVGRTIGMLDKVDQLLTWSVVTKGFKFTKSAIRVLEPLRSLPLGAVSAIGNGLLEIKGAVEGFSIVVKAVALSKELYMVLLKGFGFTKGAVAAFNELNRKSFRKKHSEGEYSCRTEVSFKGQRYNQRPSMPPLIWSLTETKRKCYYNRWEFIDHPYSTEEVGFSIKTAEVLGDVEDASPLPISILMLARSFDPEPSLEIPN